MASLIISLAVILILVFILTRKGIANPHIFMTFSIFGAVMYYIVYLMTKQPLVDGSTSGVFLDILKTYTSSVAGTFTGIGMAMVPVYGFSMYMAKVGASKKFGDVAGGLISKSKYPYFIGIGFAIILTAIIRLGIPSAFATMALLFATVYPVLLKIGISRVSAVTAVFLGTCFDWGPADFVVGLMLSGAGQSDIAGYFLNLSMFITPIVVIVTALVAGAIFKWIDKKEGYVMGSDSNVLDGAEVEEESQDKLPGYYAIFPLLPLFFLIFISDLVIKGVSISVFSSVLLSVIVVFLVECSRKKSIKDRFNDLNDVLVGMGESFAKIFLVVAAGSFFAAGLIKLGGFNYMVETVLNMGLSGWIFLIVLGILSLVMSLFLGANGMYVTMSFSAPILTIANALGIPFYAALYPIQMATGLRIFNLGTGIHTIYCTQLAECTPIAILKRIAIPSVLIYVVSFLSSLLMV